MTLLLNDFGFKNLKDFTDSLFAPQYKLLLITFSGITSIGEYFFGISDLMLLLLVILVNIELITGIWASRVRGRKIVSRRLQRFLLKIMIYFFFIMLLHRLSLEVTLDFTRHLYDYMHAFVIMYFVGVHIKSIAENYGRISGKRKSEFNQIVIEFFKKMFSSSSKKK